VSNATKFGWKDGEVPAAERRRRRRRANQARRVNVLRLLRGRRA
jgi:hypothetical protein